MSMLTKISIHAPREGSDGICGKTVDSASKFLSTLPARGATRPQPARERHQTHFYPRSPRGERLNPSQYPSGFTSYFYPRSPRGERRPPLRTRSAAAYFYPRSPRGERLALVFHPLDSSISIHAPREGSDHHHQPDRRHLRRISIHAPREGSDLDLGRQDGDTHPHFYPRSPRGERPAPAPAAAPPIPNFYPRSPRGERLYFRRPPSQSRYFYPRSPRGERPA